MKNKFFYILTMAFAVLFAAKAIAGTTFLPDYDEDKDDSDSEYSMTIGNILH